MGTDKKEQQEDNPFEHAVVSPPTDGTCPVCAVKHRADEPHCKSSIYYQMRFFRAYGRFATTKDAASDLQAKMEIVQEYAKRGIVLEIGKGKGN